MNEKYTILIIDDIDENITILQRQMENKGFLTLSANEGPKGLHILKNQHVDLVLLDINMPVLDGITMLRNIKKDSRLTHVAVMMVTANEDMKTTMECLKNGACGYITKPYDMNLLIKQINHCLNIESS